MVRFSVGEKDFCVRRRHDSSVGDVTMLRAGIWRKSGSILGRKKRFFCVRRRHDSSVGDVTMLRAGRRRKSGSILGRSKRFFCPDRLWGPFSSCWMGMEALSREIKGTGREGDLHLPR